MAPPNLLLYHKMQRDKFSLIAQNFMMGKEQTKSEKPDAAEILDGKTLLRPGKGEAFSVVICTFG